MEPHELVSLVEALLFVSDQPMTVNALTKAVDDEAVTAAEIKEALATLETACEENQRGVRLGRFGRGYQFVTEKRYSPWVEGLLSGRRKARLTRAALETAAVIAYKQPLTRLEIERIRGVDAGGVLNTLLERGLIMIKGRDSGPGRALMYGTTQTFLEYFGLGKLGDLPRLEELVALAKSEQAAMWDDGELARFEKFGVAEEDVPPMPTEDAAPEEGDTMRDDTDQAADRAGFQEVVADLTADEAPEKEVPEDGEAPANPKPAEDDFVPPRIVRTYDEEETIEMPGPNLDPDTPTEEIQLPDEEEDVLADEAHPRTP